MPTRSPVREIIPARAARVAPSAALARHLCTPEATRRTAYSPCPLNNGTRHYSTRLKLLLGNTSSEPAGSFWCLFLSAIQPSTSRFAFPLRQQTSTRVHQGSPELPSKHPAGCQRDSQPCPTYRTTPDSPLAPQGPSERPGIGVCHKSSTTLVATLFDDSNGQGLKTCRRRKAQPPTCGQASSPTCSASPHARCAGGVRQGVDRPSSRKAGLFGTAPTSWISGPAQVADSLTREEMPTRRHSPARETAASGESAERVGALDPLAVRPPQAREVSVTPTTVAPARSLRATAPRVSFPTSCLISARPVIR